MKRPIAAFGLGVLTLGTILPAVSPALAHGSSWSLEDLCGAVEQADQEQCRLDVQQALEQKAREESKQDDDKSGKKSEKNSGKKSEEGSKKKSEKDSGKKSEKGSKKKSEKDSGKKSENDSDDNSGEDSELPPLPELSPEPEDSDAPPLPEPPEGSVKNCQITNAPSVMGNLWIMGLLLLRRRR